MTPCPNLAHSPTLAAGKWSCSDCETNKPASPLARLHAALDRRPSDSEWSIFLAALRQAAGPGGFVSQTKVRPLIQAIPHKHRGQLYTKAIKAGVIQHHGFEPSTDAAGRNTDKAQRTYLLTERAAA